MTKKNKLLVTLAVVSALIATAIGLSLSWKAERRANATPTISSTLVSDMKTATTIKIETSNSQENTTSRHIITDTNIADEDNGAREIILNSADEPREFEAPEIKLDENDNPVVDAEGAPILK